MFFSLDNVLPEAETLGPRKESHLEGDNFFTLCRKETPSYSVLCEKIIA